MFAVAVAGAAVWKTTAFAVAVPATFCRTGEVAPVGTTPNAAVAVAAAALVPVTAAAPMLMAITSVAPNVLTVSALAAPTSAKRMVSTPAPALIASLPRPGVMVLAPPPDVMVSLPAPVKTVLAFAPKVTVSLLPPVVTVNAPAVAAVGPVTVTPAAKVPKPEPVCVNVTAPVAADAS